MPFECLCNLYYNNKPIKNSKACPCQFYKRNQSVPAIRSDEYHFDFDANQNHGQSSHSGSNHTNFNPNTTFLENPCHSSDIDLYNYNCLSDELIFHPNINHLYKNIQILKNDQCQNGRLNVFKYYHGENFYFEYVNIRDGSFYFCSNKNCFNKYKTKNGIFYHMESNCINNDTKYKFICPFQPCIKKFKTKNGVKYHIETKHSYNA